MRIFRSNVCREIHFFIASIRVVYLIFTYNNLFSAHIVFLLAQVLSVRIKTKLNISRKQIINFISLINTDLDPKHKQMRANATNIIVFEQVIQSVHLDIVTARVCGFCYRLCSAGNATFKKLELEAAINFLLKGFCWSFLALSVILCTLTNS